MLRKRPIHEAKTQPHRPDLPVRGPVAAGNSLVWFCPDVGECADGTEFASGANAADFPGPEYAEPASECAVVLRSPDGGCPSVVELGAGRGACNQEQPANLG